MGIRTRLEQEKVDNSEEKGHDVTIVVDNGGGGGKTFDADIYFEYEGAVFNLAASSKEDPNPDPEGEAPKKQPDNKTMRIVWKNETIEYEKSDGTATTTNFVIKLRYPSGVNQESTVKAWGWKLKNGQHDERSTTAEEVLQKL